MPMSRRLLFGHASAVAAVASLPGCMVVAPAAASICRAAPYLPAADDAELIAACERSLNASSEYGSICERLDENDPQRAPQLSACSEIEQAARELAIDLAATTTVGIEAKARLLVARFPLAPDGSHYDCPSPDELLALSIAADILARAS